MAAKSDTLGTLHALFADYWMDQMKRTDEDGKIIPLSAAEAAVLRAFLKDNNVQADPTDNNDIKDLSQQLRTATAGTVDTSELDSILDSFMASTQSLGNH